MPKPRDLSTPDDAAKSDAEVLEEIARTLHGLTESHRDPGRYFEIRDELVRRLRRVAARLAKQPERAGDLTTFRPKPLSPTLKPGIGAFQRTPAPRTIFVKRV